MSSNPPKKGLDTAEGIQAAFAALGIGQELIQKIKELPPVASRKAVDYARVFGAAEDGLQMKVAKLVDQITADIAD